MGNESSQLKNLEINKKAVEVADFWSLFNAEVHENESNNRLVSIFQSENITTGQLWANENPLERSIKVQYTS
jgi:SCY1-like protein 3